MTGPPTDITIDTDSPDQTVRCGAAIGRLCEAGDVIALQGELGAGKTQLVRGLAEGMGLDPGHVSSPTFVMMQEYEPARPEQGRPVLVHIDAYRIQSQEDLVSIGWHGFGEEVRDQAVVAVEWAGLIEPSLGDDALWVAIEHAPGGRRLLLSARGLWWGKMKALSESLRDAGLTPTEGAEP